jgi:WXXGXW repeat (2 copies)
MIKYVLPAGAVALALGVPAAQAQMAPPIPAEPYGYTTTTSTTISGDGQAAAPNYAELQPGYGAAGPGDMAPTPMPGFYPPPVTPRTTWIPGHYNWDPTRSNYVWTGGHYAEAPADTAQWVPGHWVQTPTSWIWIEGGWK